MVAKLLQKEKLSVKYKTASAGPQHAETWLNNTRIYTKLPTPQMLTTLIYIFIKYDVIIIHYYVILSFVIMQFCCLCVVNVNRFPGSKSVTRRRHSSKTTKKFKKIIFENGAIF